MAIDPKIKRKIKALMARAADQTNEHEADACRARALEVAARYGVEVSKLDTDEGNEVIRKDIDFSGSYTDMQFALVNALGSVLHCTVVMFKVPRSSRVKTACIFGRKNHVERIDLLNSLLAPQMIAGATKAYNADPRVSVSATTVKRSWMTGFIATIAHRLREIEQSVTDEYGRTDIHGNAQSGELVLRSDRAKANDLAHEHFPNLVTSKASRRKFDGESFNSGSVAGDNTDLGQTRVRRGSRAICS